MTLIQIFVLCWIEKYQIVKNITVPSLWKTGCHSKNYHTNDRRININLYLDLANPIL